MSLSRTKKVGVELEFQYESIQDEEVGVELEFQYESIQDEEGRSRTRVPV